MTTVTNRQVRAEDVKYSNPESGLTNDNIKIKVLHGRSHACSIQCTLWQPSVVRNKSRKCKIRQRGKRTLLTTQQTLPSTMPPSSTTIMSIAEYDLTPQTRVDLVTTTIPPETSKATMWTPLMTTTTSSPPTETRTTHLNTQSAATATGRLASTQSNNEITTTAKRKCSFCIKIEPLKPTRLNRATINVVRENTNTAQH